MTWLQFPYIEVFEIIREKSVPVRSMIETSRVYSILQCDNNIY